MSTTSGSNSHELAGGSFGARAGYFGVEGLDALIPGGLTYDTQVMVQGDTGVGKSVLSAQFIYEGLLVGDACVYVACDEPPSLMRQHMASLRLGTAAYERTGQMIFMDAYSRDRSLEKHHVPDPGNFDEFFLYQKRVIESLGNRPVRLAVDSISTILSTAPAGDIIDFSGHRLRYLRSRRILTLDVYVGGVIEDRAVAGLAHMYPMILRMSFAGTSNGGLRRYLQIGKLKSGQFTSTQHQFRIDDRTGLIVEPDR